MDKPSCIAELKELANTLSDRDISIKACYAKVKSIINCPKTSNEDKVEKIKKICNGI